MQRRLVTWLAAVILIAHGLLGCCWHHRHVHASAGSDRHHAPDAAAQTCTTPAAGETASQPATRACCHHGHHQPPVKSPAVPDAEPHDLASTSGPQPESPAEPAPATPCTEDDCVFVAGSRGAVAVDQADGGPPAYPVVDWTPGWPGPQLVALDGAWLGRDRDKGADLGGWRAHRMRTGVWLI